MSLVRAPSGNRETESTFRHSERRSPVTRCRAGGLLFLRSRSRQQLRRSCTACGRSRART